MQAAVLCTRAAGSGTVRVRDTCRANETPVDPVALGLQGPKGDPGIPGAPGPGVVVRDSQGAVIGAVVDVNPWEAQHGDRFTILRSLGPTPVLLTVDRTGYFGWVPPWDQPETNLTDRREAVLWFEDSDCTGLPHLVVGDGDRFVQRPAVEWGPRGCTGDGPVVCRRFALLPDGPGSPRPLRASGSLDGRRCTPESAPYPMTAPAISFDLSTLGVPPFHVEGL